MGNFWSLEAAQSSCLILFLLLILHYNARRFLALQLRDNQQMEKKSTEPK